MDILDRLRASSVRTHWQGCEDHHDICAAIEEIERLRDRVRILEETEGLAWESAIEHHEAEVAENRRRRDVAIVMHHASQGEGCPICKTDDRCRTRAVLEGE